MAEILFVVNDFATLDPAQSTFHLIDTAHRGGHRVWVAQADDLDGAPGGVIAAARPAAALDAPPTRVDVTGLDGVWVRTNPGRASGRGGSLMELLLQAADAGVPVRNHPMGLVRAASKLYLSCLPAATVPTTYSSASVGRLRDHLAALGGAGVVKPATGTRGQGTARVTLAQPDLDAVLAAATSGGPAVLQAYVDEAPEGDVRVHVVDGELLEVDGAAAVVRRVPAEGEWRSNVALGGQPVPAVADERIRGIVAQVGPTLRAHGLWHVGLDVVGERIVECNVFSPGGLTDIEVFTQTAFVGPLVERFVRSVTAQRLASGPVLP